MRPVCDLWTAPFNEIAMERAGRSGHDDAVEAQGARVDVGVALDRQGQRALGATAVRIAGRDDVMAYAQAVAAFLRDLRAGTTIRKHRVADAR